MRKIVSFMEFLFLENAFIKAFLLILLLLKIHPHALAISLKAEGNYSFPQVAFFRKSVFLNSRK